MGTGRRGMRRARGVGEVVGFGLSTGGVVAEAYADA